MTRPADAAIAVAAELGETITLRVAASGEGLSVEARRRSELLGAPRTPETIAADAPPRSKPGGLHRP